MADEVHFRVPMCNDSKLSKLHYFFFLSKCRNNYCCKCGFHLLLRLINTYSNLRILLFNLEFFRIVHCKIVQTVFLEVKTFHSQQIDCFAAGRSCMKLCFMLFCLVARPSKYSELCIISLTGLVINWRRGLKRWQIAPFKRTMHFLFNYPLSFKSAASIIHGLWATKRAALFDFSAFAGPGLAAFLFLF
jgi:hypothetical protein